MVAAICVDEVETEFTVSLMVLTMPPEMRIPATSATSAPMPAPKKVNSSTWSIALSPASILSWSIWRRVAFTVLTKL